MRAAWEASGAAKKSNYQKDNNYEKKSFTRKELYEMIQEGVKRQLKESAAGKKCKEHHNLEDDDSLAELNLSLSGSEESGELNEE